MITSDIVIAIVIKKIEAVKADWGLVEVVEGKEDLQSDDLTPPYLIVYENFTDTAQITGDGTPHYIPIDIEAVVVSSEKETASKSFKQALTLAISVIKEINGYYELKEEEDKIYFSDDNGVTWVELGTTDEFTLGDDKVFLLESKELPFQILGKSSKISTIKTLHRYRLSIII